MEIVLVPERGFFRWRRGSRRAGDILDVVGISRYQRDRAIRPQGRNHAGRATAPIVAAQHRALDVERVQERDQVRAEGPLLARTRRVRIQKTSRPEAAQIRDDHPRSGFGEFRGDFGIGVDIVGEAVAQHARPAVGGAVLLVGDPKDAGVDCLEHHRGVLACAAPARASLMQRCVAAYEGPAKKRLR